MIASKSNICLGAVWTHGYTKKYSTDRQFTKPKTLNCTSKRRPSINMYWTKAQIGHRRLSCHWSCILSISDMWKLDHANARNACKSTCVLHKHASDADACAACGASLRLSLSIYLSLSHGYFQTGWMAITCCFARARAVFVRMHLREAVNGWGGPVSQSWVQRVTNKQVLSSLYLHSFACRARARESTCGNRTA